MEMISRGNHKNYEEHPEKSLKTLNKEDKNSHLTPLPIWVLLLSPYLHHTQLGLIMKQFKNDRMVFDASTQRTADDFVLNQHTPTHAEPPITFGTILREFYVFVYNLRVSFPFLEIFIALADIKACFRYPCIHANLTGAFGFMATEAIYCLATAMVFGSIVSASSWEPFQRAIQTMSREFFYRDNLVEKHKAYLDMIAWDTFCPPGTIFTKAKGCVINGGVFNSDGSMRPLSALVYVDDALLATAGVVYMKKLLAATNEAFFVVMGEPVHRFASAHSPWISGLN